MAQCSYVFDVDLKTVVTPEALKDIPQVVAMRKEVKKRFEERYAPALHAVSYLNMSSCACLL